MKNVLLIAVMVVVMASSALAMAPEPPALGCRLQGSWLAHVDVGGVFFVQYSGANAAGGSLSIEWIRFDPTLFGNFPSAVRITQGTGSWRNNGTGYDYTWIAYGIDKNGAPVYSIRTSGKGTIEACDTIPFDYVLEVFPAPMNPLTDTPVTCISGQGTKVRIPVVRAACQ